MADGARKSKGVAVARYVEAGATGMVAGMALATGNKKLAAVAGVTAAGLFSAGRSAEAAPLDKPSGHAAPVANPIASAGSVDGLAYASNTAASLAGGQMARDVRKGAAETAVDGAKGAATAQKARGTRKAAAVTPAANASTMSKAGTALAKANPLIAAGAGAVMASTAYNAARDAGASKMQAAGAAATAAAPSVATAAAPTVLGRLAPAVASGLSKLALPLTAASAAVGAAKGGYKAYQEGAGAGEIAGKAALGAADQLTFGLATAAWEKATGKGQMAKEAMTPQPQQKAIAATPRGTLMQTQETAGQASGGKQAAKPDEPAQKSTYTTIDGRTVEGTEAQQAAWKARRKAENA